MKLPRHAVQPDFVTHQPESWHSLNNKSSRPARALPKVHADRSSFEPAAADSDRQPTAAQALIQINKQLTQALIRPAIASIKPMQTSLMRMHTALRANDRGLAVLALAAAENYKSSALIKLNSAAARAATTDAQRLVDTARALVQDSYKEALMPRQ